MVKRVSFSFCLVFVALDFSFHHVYATEFKNDKVVATVNDYKFYQSDIEHARKQLPPDVKQYSKAALHKYILKSLIDTHLAAAAARKADFDKRPKISKRLRRIEDQVLYQAYLDDQIKGSLSEEQLKKHYQKYLISNSKSDEIRARHILLQTQEQAIEILRQLNQGGDFKNLARKFSTGPSGKKGGDLGYFTRERMVKSFSEAAFATPVGSFTSKPIKTQFGWHIIKVENKRKPISKSFDEIKTQLREKIIIDLVYKVISKLRKTAKIKIFSKKEK
jgi:peptidyl-prolyl cis-trans isomerase C